MAALQATRLRGRWDVDHFKRITDTYGHRAVIAFCAPLPNALRVIVAMRDAIAAIRFRFRDTPVSITISIGVTALLTADSRSCL